MLDLIFNSERGEFTETGFLLIFVGIPVLLIFLTFLLIRRINKRAFKKVLRRVKKMTT